MGMSVELRDYIPELCLTEDGWCLRMGKDGDIHTVTMNTCTCGDHMWRDALCRHIRAWALIRRELKLGGEMAP